jgi:hypothetical protein
MTSEVLTLEYDAGADVYLRIWNDSGQVFDFDDDTFKALSGAVEPYLAMTERADMAGTGRSGYQATVDLATVNKTGTAKRYTVKAYDNGTPADADNPVAEPLGLTVQFGRLGERPVRCELEAALTSTAGSAVRLTAWLEHGGEIVDLSTLDPTASVSIGVREHGAGANLFTVTDGGAGPNASDRFEVTQSTPGFTDDRLYSFLVSITANGVTHTTQHLIPVHG